MSDADRAVTAAIRLVFLEATALSFVPAPSGSSPLPLAGKGNGD
jgi:hypothetical protein